MAEPTPRGARRHPVLAGVDATLAMLLLIGVWVFLPTRYLPVDLGGSALAVALLLAAGGLFVGASWGRSVGIAVAGIALVTGALLVTALAFTAGNLFGLYGPVGKGVAAVLATVSALLVPYLVAAPAAQLYVLLGVRSGTDPR